MTIVEQLLQTGIRRLGNKERGFRYVRSGGGRPGAEDLARIRALAIPPAWRDVGIHPSARGAVQAIGRDAAGRWQYLYHPASSARHERKKYERLTRFGSALPRMRRALTRDLARPDLSREKVLASVLRILSMCFLRSGSQVYADENGSYGIASLRREHVSVSGDLVKFDFPGKSGKRQEREMRDRRVASTLRQLTREPGKVFKYRDAEEKPVNIRRRHINGYIREVMGGAFTAKDFRTWAATLICACILSRDQEPAPDTKTARRSRAAAALRETAEWLGNTPAICKASYVAPCVLKDFAEGRILGPPGTSVEELVRRRSPGLHRVERALLRRLQESTRPRS
jgi:DNA topoisomerase I